VRIGRAMPKKVGDVGFVMVVHPRDDKTVWVLPMDGQTVWPRTSPDGRPSVYSRRTAARPGCVWTMAAGRAGVVDGEAPGHDGGFTRSGRLYFGTTSGDLWMSRDEGARWTTVARHLPEIYAVEAAEVM
jgi:hypothetical protein